MRPELTEAVAVLQNAIQTERITPGADLDDQAALDTIVAALGELGDPDCKSECPAPIPRLDPAPETKGQP